METNGHKPPRPPKSIERREKPDHPWIMNAVVATLAFCTIVLLAAVTWRLAIWITGA